MTSTSSLLAQERAPAAQDPEGRTIAAIQIEDAKGDRRFDQAGAIYARLKTLVGAKFRSTDVDSDLQMLWREWKIRAQSEFEILENGDVRVFFVVMEQLKRFDRVMFAGQKSITEESLRSLLQLRIGQSVTEELAESNAATIEERLRRDGYRFAKVAIEKDEARSELTFRIDEGPKVTVRNVFFRGNTSFPGWAPLGLYQNLIGSSDIVSRPAGALLAGAAYSEQTIEEDLERLRTFYRGRGYRDAHVELSERTFVDGETKVDLTFLVSEGRRYRVTAVDVQQSSADENPDYEPLYPRAELLAELKLKPGDFYDRDVVNQDKRAIERYYGKRGHPLRSRFGASRLQNALAITEPSEVFDVERAELKLVYRVTEGTPKRLRTVHVRGNTKTKDYVIRRKVFLRPGEILDMTEVERSLNTLDSLRYFTDPEQLTGVRFDLTPVQDDPDLVDLVIEVQEGDTGQLLWGAGISTGQGVIGRIQFLKRNFDIGKLPSSFAPGTFFREIVRGDAFHGAGQELDISLQPGSEISTFSISFYDPDVFRRHFDTIGLNVVGSRTIRLLDGYDTDELRGYVALERNFTEQFSVSLGVRQSTSQVENVEANASSIVIEAEGKTELRGLRAAARLRELDHRLRPTDGYHFEVYTEVMGGPFGAEKDIVKSGLLADVYWPFHRDSLQRPHVLRSRTQFDFGDGYGRDDELYLGERFFLGGSNLRGFDQRRVGPTQFGRPIGGAVRAIQTLEYQFPMVSTRLENQFRETELVRGLLFVEGGSLGLDFGDRGLQDLRVSAGFGFRIHVPVLGLPIALDFAWPLSYEETDSRRVFYFSLSR